ncbi:ABC transporter ATP-binding protein [Mycoplasma phocimorsus]|uniref:Sn-glycerol-3-phosphate ABC transporter ATP-binding protein UgpC n=1 Tax=Mycoplasma phocimorsus TaxID=3045839 RepID=A0AAJ1UWS5_9MOLU|nr:sn-glycerol-3-phosphate ABC transporter ATP-binding protein UgpC [Mycoplasma phocimorsus]MDJ1645765.1 sn-glycerol-3-phosphate ABC transporter ATP-binding protein UgpC [Mycoplasma phocimorsus]MDJ1646689.1 sn-glycerol-3-phosphate ABC transporter ATP-binding protein UgpC [Mycoplasma phocimorsus]MDJ1647262.1 sn-glycerol-3-phosphate ABC transporter ATP-binding protein UgpC [Mycoplasma phocimorsus]MDJ1648382.1 sn-glycerol-3-phosphate ABC transporter ATP-binding protein UgpC [Mycoplasma phocimorsus
MKIEFRNIAKKYAGRENYTLQDINFKIDDQEFIALLGPSGCGKSTLLRMLAGLNSITKGDLLFDNIRVNGLSPKDRDIAMVFQSYALYPHYNVYDNIAFGLKIRHEPKDLIDKRVNYVAKTLKIEEYLSNKPGDISGGQRQRVALGRAIARKPKLFLMDEPLSNLDAKLRENMRSEIVKIHKLLKTTTVYVTHDQLEAMTMADRVILMNASVIQQIGKPRELYERPANIFVAKFIGTPTMNILKVKKSGDTLSLDGRLIIKLSLEQQKLLENYENNQLYIGIRSENISLTSKTEESNVEVELILHEILGKEEQGQFIFEVDNNIVVTMAPGQDLTVGNKYLLKFDTSKLHFFDAESEKRIN